MNKEGYIPAEDVKTAPPGQEEKSKGGAPPFFSTPEELEAKVEEYFKSLDGEFHYEADPEEEGKDIKVWDVFPDSPTITGLCLFLGFESRQSFYDYGNRSEFSYTIKRARLRIEHNYEKVGNFAKNPAFQVFALKNLGWSDKQEIDHTTKGQALGDSADLSKLTEEELRIRAAIDRKSRGA